MLLSLLKEQRSSRNINLNGLLLQPDMKFKCVELYVNDTIFNKKIVKTVNICKTDGDEKTNSLTSYLSSLLLPFSKCKLPSKLRRFVIP